MRRIFGQKKLKAPSNESPLHLVGIGILTELRHLDLSGRVSPETTKVIQCGTFGDVFKANCTLPRRGTIAVALKRVRFYIKEDIKALFEKEIYVWSKLNHPNILPLLGYTFDEGTGYPQLVSEWMDNGSISKYIRENSDHNLMHMIIGIAEGLAYLHSRGVVHSDIKPDNILVSNSGAPVICDFGCSRMVAASRSLANMSSGPKGTTRYLAFELVAPEEEHASYSKKSDVWAFGMTIFEILTRQLPYAKFKEIQVYSAIVKRILPTLPPSCEFYAKDFLWSICLRCWDFNPSSRADMDSILIDLRNTLVQNINPELRPSMDHTEYEPPRQESRPAPSIHRGATAYLETDISQNGMQRAPTRVMRPLPFSSGLGIPYIEGGTGAVHYDNVSRHPVIPYNSLQAVAPRQYDIPEYSTSPNGSTEAVYNYSLYPGEYGSRTINKKTTIARQIEILSEIENKYLFGDTRQSS